MAIAVTGVGARSAFGDGVSALWDNLVAGACALTEPAWLGATGPVGLVPGRSPGHRSSAFACDAARQALGDRPPPPGLAVVGASTSGDMWAGEDAFQQDLLTGAPERPGAYLWHQLCHRPAQAVARSIGATGPAVSVSSACSSGTVALSVGADLLRMGRAPAVLVVGADALCRTTVHGFAALGVHSSQRCRPFDAERTGMNLGEGAGALLLEPLDVVLARGGVPLALLSGSGDASDAHHLTAPDPSGAGAEAAIRAALGGVDPCAVTYVNAHGTGTLLNDAMEATVLGRVLPDAAVSGVKGAIGHTLGAAGAIEAVVAVCALDSQRLPPSTGLRQPLASLDFVRHARDCAVAHVLSVNFAFGGHNAAVLFSRWSP